MDHDSTDSGYPLLTRPRSSTVLSVTGSVIEDEEVLKAVIRAGDMAHAQ